MMQFGQMRKVGLLVARAALVCLILLFSPVAVSFLSPALAQDGTEQTSAEAQKPADPGELQIEATKEEGFGRIVLNFAGRNLLPQYSIKQDNSIFVLRFEERMKSSSVTALPRILPDYVSIARLDPDGKGVRIAFKENVRINTMEAGERLYIDLLPSDWTGLPPSLPADIVAELAKRAEKALRLARSLQQAQSATRIQPKLDIRIGEHPTFARFAFVWNIPFDSTFERQGEQVFLYFNHKTDVDLSEIRASLPALVRDMSMTIEDGRAKFTIQVVKQADVRAFREENAYIVDVSGDKTLFKAADAEDQITRAISRPGDTGVLIAKGIDLDASDNNEEQALAASGEKRVGSDEKSGLILGPGPDGKSAMQTLFSDEQQAAQPPALSDVKMDNPAPSVQSSSQFNTAPTTPKPAASTPVSSTRASSSPLATGPADPTSASASVSTPVSAPEVVPPGGMPARTGRGNAEQMQGAGQDLTSTTLRVEAKQFGQSVRLFFPFKNPTAAAVFRKNGIIWAVFETNLVLDASEAQLHLGDLAEDLEIWRAGNVAVLRIPLKNPRLTTFSPEGYGWLLTIGDMVVEPTKPLHMTRTKISGGRSALQVPFEAVGSILQLRDPTTGENLHVVTGYGPARGFVKGQRFVDFTTLVSAHGIALSEHVDDLQVLRDETFVYISSEKGLTLSNAEQAAAEVGTLLNGDGRERESFLDLTSKIAKTPVIFSRERQELERQVAKYDDLMAIQSEMALAKLLVANGYAFEALGHLQIIEQSAPEFARGKAFRTLYSAAELFANRPDPAFRRLDHPEFESDPDASVWRGLAAMRTKRWRKAKVALDMANSVAKEYSPKVQQMLMLDKIKLQLLDQKYGDASAMLAEINPAFLDKEGIARYNFLRGKVAVARSKPDEAIAAFSAAQETDYLPVARDAWLQEIKLQKQENQIDVDKAIDDLEGLTTIWRGDDIELNALRTLAHLYVDKGAYRNAFETMKAATKSDPVSEISRVLQEEMNGVFSSLFLDGKANSLSAIKALSLYYDFRELTPVGRRGDEMVRRLADKLVEVDLLGRAAELLNHQVENRLKGAARSQIAADLAVVYLLDSKPNLALDTLRRTRQSQLPLSLERQRRLVEAKALAELNKVNLALDLLEPLQGQDVDQLRADIMWRAKRWQDTGEQIELMMGDRWNLAGALDKDEQTNILRAGISYSLADDKLGLDRLRRKYADKMAETPVSSAFEVVTLPIERTGQRFQSVAQEIAGIDTMERFLKDYRNRYLSGSEKPVEQQAPAKTS